MKMLLSIRLSPLLGTALLLAACGGPVNQVGNVAAPAPSVSTAAVANPPSTQPQSQPTTVTQGFEKGFNRGFAETFTPSCRSGAASSGLPAAKIAEVCDCALADLQTKFSATQLMALTPDQGKPSLEMCAAKAGLVKRGG